MKVVFTEPFLRSFSKMPALAKKKFQKQIGFLLTDIRHPSLRAKKYIKIEGVWQARVDNSFRFYFQIRQDIYYILNACKHPK